MLIWAEPCEIVFQAVPAYMYVDSEGPALPDQGIHSPLTESFDIIECINREQMTRWDCACAIWICILCMIKDTFSHNVPICSKQS